MPSLRPPPSDPRARGWDVPGPRERGSRQPRGPVGVCQALRPRPRSIRQARPARGTQQPSETGRNGRMRGARCDGREISEEPVTDGGVTDTRTLKQCVSKESQPERKPHEGSGRRSEANEDEDAARRRVGLREGCLRGSDRHALVWGRDRASSQPSSLPPVEPGKEQSSPNASRDSVIMTRAEKETANRSCREKMEEIHEGRN